MISEARQEFFRENVARGAVLMDEKIPGWHEEVRGAMLDGIFAMNNWEQCMVGSIERVEFFYDYDRASRSSLVIQFNGTQLVSQREAERHGFYIDHVSGETASDEEYEFLDQCWRNEIQRRSPDVEIPPPVYTFYLQEYVPA